MLIKPHNPLDNGMDVMMRLPVRLLFSPLTYQEFQAMNSLQLQPQPCGEKQVREPSWSLSLVEDDEEEQKCDDVRDDR